MTCEEEECRDPRDLLEDLPPAGPRRRVAEALVRRWEEHGRETAERLAAAETEREAREALSRFVAPVVDEVELEAARLRVTKGDGD